VIMDSAFNVLEIWKDIPRKKLPAAIEKQIQDNYKSYTFSEQQSSMMVKEKDETTYFVSLLAPISGETNWLFFNDKGQLIKKESHSWKTAGL